MPTVTENTTFRGGELVVLLLPAAASQLLDRHEDPEWPVATSVECYDLSHLETGADAVGDDTRLLGE